MTKRGWFSLSAGCSWAATDFKRMKVGGLDAVMFSLYVPDRLQDKHGPKQTKQMIDRQIEMIKQQANCAIVDTTEAAERAQAADKVPIFLGLEGGRLLGGDVSRLAALRKAGVRYLTVTHNKSMNWADSSTDLPKSHGLVGFGKAVLREAEKVGVIMDVSHVSDQTCRDITELSTKPVIASHSGCRAIVSHPRNLSDELIRRVSDTGGVVHVPFVRQFIGETALGVVAHIEHIVQLLGDTRHVGIGSDLDGAELAFGAEDVSQWWRVTGEALADRGYSGGDIAMITGGNTLRLLE